MPEDIVESLEGIGDLSANGASEAEIETEIVVLFRHLGWRRQQIRQNFPLTDRATDRADIVLNGEGASVLIEVKRKGQSVNAEEQVRRYSRLLTPAPRLAILTDGIRWVFYYSGRLRLIRLLDATVPKDMATVSSTIERITPEQFHLWGEEVFEFLNVIEQGLENRSEVGRERLMPYFTSTVLNLLIKSAPKKPPAPPGIPVPPTGDEEGDDEKTHQPLPSLPSLRHSRIRSGYFQGEMVRSWSDLTDVAIRMACRANLPVERIRECTGANLREGAFSEDGFHPVSGTALSVQGMEANRCWRTAYEIAKILNGEIAITVVWGQRANEEQRGQTRDIRWSPS